MTVLRTYDLAVTVSLGIQKILWSSSLVLCELCHLLSHLPALLSQLVECRNRQDLKYILDLWNVLTSCKFLVVNLVKESFHLPHLGYPQFLNAHILGIENLPSGLAQDCPSLHLLSKDNNTSPLSSQVTLGNKFNTALLGQ